MMSRRVAGWLTALAACFVSPPAEAGESVASYCFPGAFGSFLVAVPPEPGFSVVSQTPILSANAQRSLLNGRQTFGIGACAVHQYLAGPYAFEQPILGGRLLAASRPAGATGSAAIFTDRIKPAHIIRKVLLRQTAILNDVVPF